MEVVEIFAALDGCDLDVDIDLALSTVLYSIENKCVVLMLCEQMNQNRL